MTDKPALSRTREIVEVIISGIKKGTFKPGERIPSQVEMADLFGVSRTVIREAIKILEGQGIISSRRGSGIYVNAFYNSAEDSAPGANGNTVEICVRDILEVGRQLWVQAINLIIENASSLEIDTMVNMTKAFYDKFSTKTSIQQRYIRESTFGLTTTKYSHNPLLHKVMVELFEVTSDIDYAVINDYNKYKEIVEIDLKIVEALQERNKERATFFSRERDRLVDQIISDKDDLLNKIHRINLKIY